MQQRIKIAFMAFSVVFAVSCAKETSQDIPAGSRGVPDEIFTDFLTQESDSGKVKWRLTAPRASKYNAKRLIVLEKPTIEFYDELGELQTTLTSRNGELYQDSQNMLAFGNVIVKSIAGDILETDSLFWMDAGEKIVSNSFVKLTRGNDVMTGIGLECDYNLSEVKIKRDVKAMIIDERGTIDE